MLTIYQILLFTVLYIVCFRELITSVIVSQSSVNETRFRSGNVTHGILATITQEMDTVATHGLDVFIIAATNRLDFLDPVRNLDVHVSC